MRFIDAQLGRILFGAAVAIAIAVNVMNPPMNVEPEPEESLRRPVKVKLVKSELATESIETFYSADNAGWVQPTDRFVFAEPKVAFVFQPVDLEVPPASIGRAPQILPDPGPSLEGAANLPRFGNEFAPLVPDGAPANPDQGRPGTTTSGAAGASTVPPSPVFNPFGGK